MVWAGFSHWSRGGAEAADGFPPTRPVVGAMELAAGGAGGCTHTREGKRKSWNRGSVEAADSFPVIATESAMGSAGGRMP